MTDRGDARAAAVGAAACAAALAWRYITFSGFTNDHYAHFALAQQILLGERPIRDFSDPGWPLMYVLSAAAWWAAGSAMVVEWAVAALGFAAGAAFTAVAALRLSGSALIALAVTALQLMVLPRTYSYPKMLAYGAAGWAMLHLAAVPSTGRLFAMAAITAIAFLLRHDHGAYIGVAAVVCVLAGAGPAWVAGLRRAALLTIMTAGLVAPWAVYVSLNGGLADYFDRGLEYARIESNATVLKTWPRLETVPGRPLVGLARPDRPLVQITWRPEVGAAEREGIERRYGLELERTSDDAHFYYVWDVSAQNLAALADDPRVAGSTGLGRVQRPAWRELAAYLSPLRIAPALHSLANAQAWLYWLFWTLPVASALLAVPWAWRMPARRPVAAAVLGISAMALLVNSGFLRDPLSARLADSIVAPGLLGAWLLGCAWTQRWYAGTLQTLARVVSLVVLLVTTAAASAIAELPERLDYTGIRDGVAGVRSRAAWIADLLASPHRQTLAPPSRVSEALMPFFAYLDRCTAITDQLLVAGDYADVLVLGGRGFASDGVVFGVWYSSVEHQAETIADMEKRPALITLIIDERDFRMRYAPVYEYVERTYREVETVAVDSGPTIRFLVLRERMPRRIDRQTGWPCYT